MSGMQVVPIAIQLISFVFMIGGLVGLVLLYILMYTAIQALRKYLRS